MEKKKMPSIRMIGLDLDGTLFDSQKQLTARTRAALEEAIARGVTVVPATGRPLRGLPQVLREIPGIRYAVMTNGAGVYDLESGACIYHSCMDRDAAAELLARTRHLRAVQGAFVGAWGYMEPMDSTMIGELPLVEAMKEYLRSSRKIVESLPSFLRGCAEGPQKVVLMFLPDNGGGDRAEAERILQEYPQFAYVSGGVANFEIMGSGVGKGKALLALGAQLGIEPEEIMAVGDSENDLDMVLRAGLGVAMANAEEIVKRHADAITASNDEDGVARAIETYVFRQ